MSLIRPPMKFSADHQASAPPPIDYHHHISRVLLPVLILLPLYITRKRNGFSRVDKVLKGIRTSYISNLALMKGSRESGIFFGALKLQRTLNNNFP